MLTRIPQENGGKKSSLGVFVLSTNTKTHTHTHTHIRVQLKMRKSSDEEKHVKLFRPLLIRKESNEKNNIRRNSTKTPGQESTVPHLSSCDVGKVRFFYLNNFFFLFLTFSLFFWQGKPEKEWKRRQNKEALQQHSTLMEATTEKSKKRYSNEITISSCVSIFSFVLLVSTSDLTPARSPCQRYQIPSCGKNKKSNGTFSYVPVDTTDRRRKRVVAPSSWSESKSGGREGGTRVEWSSQKGGRDDRSSTFQSIHMAGIKEEKILKYDTTINCFFRFILWPVLFFFPSS